MDEGLPGSDELCVCLSRHSSLSRPLLSSFSSGVVVSCVLLSAVWHLLPQLLSQPRIRSYADYRSMRHGQVASLRGVR